MGDNEDVKEHERASRIRNLYPHLQQSQVNHTQPHHTDTEVVLCRHCGSELRAGTRYCKYCGTQVTLPGHIQGQGTRQADLPLPPSASARPSTHNPMATQIPQSYGLISLKNHEGPALIGIGALFAIIGLFLPWAQGIMGISANGFSGGPPFHGPLSLLCSFILLSLAMIAFTGSRGRGIYVASLIISIIPAVLYGIWLSYVVAEWIRVAARYQGAVSLGPGMFVVVAGYNASVIGSIIGLRKSGKAI